MITLADIQQAQKRIAPFIRRTPIERSKTFSERLGTNVYFKLEVLQTTGSFKVRGAFNKLLSLSEKPKKGVVAVSGGNHAQAVAYAAQELGMPPLIFMPSNTPSNYVDATRAYGGEIIFSDALSDAFAKIAEYEQQGWLFVHPFDDPLVAAGQGTLALEMLEDQPQITDVIVSIGGGGLMSGVAIAAKSLKPTVRVWGVETRGADAMARALDEGKVVTLPSITSIARTLGAPHVSEATLACAQKYLESVTVVPDDEALAAGEAILERAKILTEPAASCTLAAAERLRDNFGPNAHVALVLCGGNISLGDMCQLTCRRQAAESLHVH